ncbi:MAG: FMN-binding protein [Ruminococcus sp.]|nr:FMN-binding protein [Ruminococcus sp.]MBQ1432730.1 FMN-binding protein [Ruminococcus sp.]
MKKYVLTALVMTAAALTGCGGASYKDGTYTARSAEYISDAASEEESEANGYGEVEITVSGGKITDCKFSTYQLDGTPKDEDYGKKDGEIKNRDFYNKAQRARAACDNYAAQLKAKGSVDEVDAVSGATINYNEFKEAATAALKQAEE